MRVFLYEFFTGGGIWSTGEPSAETLLTEGRAMIHAIATDFAALSSVDVLTTRDSRLAPIHPSNCQVTLIENAHDEQTAIRRLAANADWTFLIAPESGGCLLARSQLVAQAGGRLLSPSSACIEIVSSKQSTAELLAQHNIPVPRGTVISSVNDRIPNHLRYPLVLKPHDGCGSQNIQLLTSPSYHSPLTSVRIEEFIPGLPASVSILAGPAGNHALLACEQNLTIDGRFTYLGGRLPLSPSLNTRAQDLARSAIATLPQPRGYFGVDLVLGNADDGSRDYVIEINPRLTTSYIGLRAASRTNLAAALLAAATGHQPNLSFTSYQLEFTPAGNVHRVSTTYHSPTHHSLFPA